MEKQNSWQKLGCFSILIMQVHSCEPLKYTLRHPYFEVHTLRLSCCTSWPRWNALWDTSLSQVDTRHVCRAFDEMGGARTRTTLSILGSLIWNRFTSAREHKDQDVVKMLRPDQGLQVHVVTGKILFNTEVFKNTRVLKASTYFQDNITLWRFLLF